MSQTQTTYNYTGKTNAVVKAYRSGPFIVPVACDNARGITWYMGKKQQVVAAGVVAECGVVQLAAIVAVIPAGTYRHSYKGGITVTH